MAIFIKVYKVGKVFKILYKIKDKKMAQIIQVSNYKIKKVISDSKEKKEAKLLPQEILKMLKIADGDF